MASNVRRGIEARAPGAVYPQAVEQFRLVRDGDVRAEQVATVEMALYVGAILLGTALRLLMIDLRPLSVEEGSFAAQSYRIVLGQMPATLLDGALPTYGTAATLGLFGYGDGAARLLSVVAGSLLVASPLLVRKLIGRVASVIAAFGIAISPLLLFASRDVGSGIVPAVLSIALLWSASRAFKAAEGWGPVLTGVALGGLVACGPVGLTAIVAIGLAAVLTHPDPTSLASELRQASSSTTWRRAAVVFVGVVLAVGAGFGANLHGIQAAVIDVWPAWLGSFSLLSPRGGLLLTIGLYELPVLLVAFGRLLATVVRRDRTDMFLSLWTMALLLLLMLQSGGGMSRFVLPMVPMYLLAARAVAGSLSTAAGVGRGWRWTTSCIALAVPAGVAMILLNRAALQDQGTPSVYIQGEAALVICALLVISLALDGHRRKALAWWAAAVLGIGFLLHTTVFLNYRLESVSRELVVGQQITPLARDVSKRAAYYNRYFDASVTVDPQLRSALDWYLLDAPSVDYASDGSQGISIELAQPGQYVVPAPAQRGPGLYAPVIDPSGFSWQGVWGWLMARDGLVNTNQRDIILRAPAGNW